MLKVGKAYSAKEVRKLIGEEAWINQISLPFNFSEKPKANSFKELEEETKQIYLQIRAHLQALNPDQEVQVWATGSRIKGTWKTIEEAEQYAALYDLKPKYSDYDFKTNAKVVEGLQELSEKLGVLLQIAGGQDIKMLVEGTLSSY